MMTEAADKHRLLVVDDSPENRDMLSRRLKRSGYDVLTAEGGREAIEAVRNSEVDLVLLDIMMPGIDGLEVLRILREKHSQSELPVIMVTAKGDSKDMVGALDLGANDYVTKPIDFPVVLARVKSQLRSKASANRTVTLTSIDFKPGAEVDGRYVIEELIGTGTFGAVYRARHKELESEVALKILKAGITSSDEALIRFRREGVSACRISHPNAVAVSDFGVTDQGVAYLVMELLHGISLGREIKDSGPLDPVRCARLLLPICEVLAEAHRNGIVHRDIKPENVFLHRCEQGEVVKVLDFGIAKLVGETVAQENLTTEGQLLGTPGYMAPERLRNEPYDGRSDVYSLGILLFQMLTGRQPFTGSENDAMSVLMMHVNEPLPRMGDIRPGVPDAVEQVVRRAADKHPENRPDAAELARAFAQAAGADLAADRL
jgi:DNA-binding response OmpR family regulator